MTLTELALKHGTDKAGAHQYTKHYERHFATLRDQPVTLLEIGIGGYANPELGGDSLRVWGEWFTHPDSQIIGVDICPKNLTFNDSRIRVVQGSQVDREFLVGLHAECGDFDIIIDDGSHVPEHVIATFEILYPKLRARGIYVVEDTQTSYWRGPWSAYGCFNPDNPTYTYFKQLPDWINYAEIPSDDEPNFYELNTIGAHFYHNLIFIDKGINDEESNILLPRSQRRTVSFQRPLVSRNTMRGAIKLGMIAHIGIVGDVVNDDFASIRSDGVEGSCIQGFVIHSSSDFALRNLKYRARTGADKWTEWFRCNEFCGSRGQSRNLTGLSFRVEEESQGQASLLVVCAFLDVEELAIAGNGEDCVAMDFDHPLVGVQVFLSSANT